MQQRQQQLAACARIASDEVGVNDYATVQALCNASKLQAMCSRPTVSSVLEVLQILQRRAEVLRGELQSYTRSVSPYLRPQSLCFSDLAVIFVPHKLDVCAQLMQRDAGLDARLAVAALQGAVSAAAPPKWGVAAFQYPGQKNVFRPSNVEQAVVALEDLLLSFHADMEACYMDISDSLPAQLTLAWLCGALGDMAFRRGNEML